jgi:hypothetical protein
MEDLSKQTNIKTRNPPSERTKQKNIERDRQRRLKNKMKLDEADRIIKEHEVLAGKLKRVRQDNERTMELEDQMKELKGSTAILNERKAELKHKVVELEHKVMELEYKVVELEDRVVQLKMETQKTVLERDFYKQLENQNQKFSLDLHMMESEKIQMELEKNHSDNINQTIVNNSKILIKQLPPNSLFTRPLLHFLLQGLSCEQTVDLYGISKRSYGRIVEESGSTLINQKYAVHVTRTRLSEEQLEEIQYILNDTLLPIQSGRDWRYQEMTDNKLYELYTAEVKNSKPVSKTFFIYKILAKEKIHHSKKVKFCPICENEDGNIAVIKHKELITIQKMVYQQDKRGVSSGKNPTTVLITQDFTQLELEGSFVQDLIICKYFYDKKAKDGLARTYIHFIGKIGTKNDILFVIGSWMALLTLNWFDDIKTVKIWSDGGPKHFKISSNMKFLLTLQQSKPDVMWEYNFFAPYHGCSICDGVAAQAKGILNVTMRDEQTAIKTPDK